MIASIVALLARLLLGPAVRYLHPIDGQQPRVFFSNHSSHLDFLVVWATLPASQREKTRPVAARDYWSGDPIRRFIAARFFRGLLIERFNPTAEDSPIDQMIDVLDSGHSLILFPEGTRGTGDAGAPFKSGLFRIAQARPAVELVPVYLENLNRILPKGEFLPVPMLTRITFGAPLRLHEGESKQEFLVRAHDAVTALREA